MANTDLGVYKSGDPFTFDAELDITVDGTPVTDLATWDPVCQLRPSASSPDVVDADLLGIDGTTVSFGIPDTATADLAGIYYADIQLTDPTADEGYATITAPGDGDYLVVTFARDITRIVEAP